MDNKKTNTGVPVWLIKFSDPPRYKGEERYFKSHILYTIIAYYSNSFLPPKFYDYHKVPLERSSILRKLYTW